MTNQLPTSRVSPFDADLERLTEIRATTRLAASTTDVMFLLGFIDKLWSEYSRTLQQLDDVTGFDHGTKRRSPEPQVAQLDEKGRCCGRKPIFYKGGSWRSPPGSPMHFCCGCQREFGPDGKHRENWAWMKDANGQLVPRRD